MRVMVQVEQVVMLLIAGAAGLAVIIEHGGITWAAAWWAIVVAGLLGLAIHLFWKSREVWYYPKEATLPGPTEVEICDDTIIRRRTEGEQRWDASAVGGISVTPGRVTVFLGTRPYEGISIAREAVTAGDFDEFARLLQKRWDDWKAEEVQPS